MATSSATYWGFSRCSREEHHELPSGLFIGTKQAFVYVLCTEDSQIHSFVVVL